ncbi:MAG: IPT/TIG domain-containing protein, partial [bacterium]
MRSQVAGRAVRAVFPLLSMIVAGCGGGGGGTPPAATFSLVGLAPTESNDLAGGETVTVTGGGFLAVTIDGATFGGDAVASFNVVSDTVLEVVTPQAPGGVEGTVDVVVSSQDAGSHALTGAYTYRAQPPPAASSISPTSFTPTGAEDFVITGTALAVPGQTTVTVEFLGVGTVVGAVSGGETTVTGRAPIPVGIPAGGTVTVTVERA